MTSQLTDRKKQVTDEDEDDDEGERRKEEERREGRERRKERIKKVKRASRLGEGVLREVVENWRDQNRKVREE